MKTLALLALCSLSARAADIQTTYFGSGWAAVPQDSAPPAPKVKASETQGLPPIGDMHNPVAHMDITLKAYQVYAARYGGGELAQYLGTVNGDSPANDNEDTVVAGSFDEDKTFKNPFNDMFPMARHFWDYHGGLHKGWNGYDSSVNRAHKYWSGGYGIEGKYDSDWGSKGKEGEGVLGLYKKGDKAKAYWYLGHVAHLVEDLCVPAHNLLFTHIGEGTDMYESYMAKHFKNWSPPAGTPVESFDALLDIFTETAKITHNYDAGHGADKEGADGDVDRGARRADGFTESELKEEGDVLMPLAYERVAELFLYFYKQIDKQPPRVTLNAPASLSNEVILSAEASDSQSGVDLRSLRYQVREGRGWTDLPGGAFRGEPGRSYSFRARVSDAVGNQGISESAGWTAGGPAVAAR
jgi:hypothetical protein